MKKESLQDESISKKESTNPETPKKENINDISIKDLANEKLALLDGIEQEKKLTEDQIKQFEYLGGKDNIDEITEEAEERISPIKQKIKTLLQKARKAIIMLATVTNLGSQAEAMTDQAKNSDFGKNDIEFNIDPNTINTINNPKTSDYNDFVKQPNLEPDPIQPLYPEREPVLDEPEGEGYKEVLNQIKNYFKDNGYDLVIGDEYYNELACSLNSNCEVENGFLITNKTKFDLSQLMQINSGLSIKYGKPQKLNVTNSGDIIITSSIGNYMFLQDPPNIINPGLMSEYNPNSDNNNTIIQSNEIDIKFPLLAKNVIVQTKKQKISEKYDSKPSALEVIRISNDVSCVNCRINYDYSFKNPIMVFSYLEG